MSFARCSASRSGYRGACAETEGRLKAGLPDNSPGHLKPLQNQRVDLVRDKFDLAIRGGPLPDSDLLARHLGSPPMSLYASAAHRDTALDQLPIIAAPGDEAMLRARRPELAAPMAVVDDRSAVAEALVAGAGAGILPSFLGEPSRPASCCSSTRSRSRTFVSTPCIYRRSVTTRGLSR